MKTKIALALFHSHSYHEYRKLIVDLLMEEKSTGNEQSEKLTNYSKLNNTRMNRLDKTIVITEENKHKLNALKKEYIWLVIAEGWCADGAQIIPILDKMSIAAHPHLIDLRIVLRDENEDVMNLFLTNGAKSIPKVIVIDKETTAVVGDWGPRPKGAIDLIKTYKEKFGVVDETAKAELQMWYFHDKGISTQNELINLMLSLEQFDLQSTLQE